MRHIFSIIFISISSAVIASNNIQATDRLLSLLKTSDSPKQKIEVYRNLADISLDKAEIKQYLWKMYQEASKAKDRKSMLNALNDIVIEAAKASQKDSVAKYTEYVKQVATPEELKHLLPFYRMRLFDSLCYMGERDEAINKELSFLNTNTDEANDVYQKIASLYIMGDSFYANDQFEKSIPYLDEAMKLTEALPKEEKFIYQKFILWRQALAYAQSQRNKESIKMIKI